MKPYLDAALDGKNDWWRYALGYLFILACYLILGSIPVLALALFAMLDGNPLTNFTQTGNFTGFPALIPFIIVISSFIPFFIAEVATVTLLHRRPFRCWPGKPASSGERTEDRFDVDHPGRREPGRDEHLQQPR